MNENRRSKSRSVTIFDIAREAGVSSSTVSRVFSGFEPLKESTRKRVMEAATRLGYVANPQARRLAGGKSQIIGVLTPSLDSGYGYIGALMHGIDIELQRADYDIMIFSTRRHEGKETHFVKTVSNGLTDGLLLIAPFLSPEYLELLRELGFPYVLLDQVDGTGSSSGVDSTNWQGAYDATRYLIELGHRRIGFIAGLMEIQSAVDRLEGYKAALARHDLPILEAYIAQGDFLESGGCTAAEQLLGLSETPTAILASNDFEAAGAMEAIRERGLQIPDDISVIGFDDIPLATMVYPKLTSVRQPLEQMGRAAARLLVERIENPDLPPRRMTLATQLVVRDTCCPPG